MVRLYKLFARARTVFCVFSALILLFPVQETALAAYDPVFTIEGVEVDVTAGSAVAAREQAMQKSREIAFERLINRLLSSDQRAGITVPESDYIATMVKDFEITEERLSNIRYIGTFTYRFKSDAVRDYLTGLGKTYSDVSSKPVLILPFYQSSDTPVIWAEDNPWMAAWKKIPLYQGLVPIAVPIGDLQDVSDIGNGQALTYEAGAMETMRKRYHAGQSVIALALPEDENNLTVMTYRAGAAGPEFMRKIKVNRKEAKEQETLFDQAVEKTRQSFLQEWKDKTTVDPMEQNRLTVRVGFSSLQEWIETRQSLKDVQGLQHIELLSLTPQEAKLSLKFQGSERRLRLALAQQDMTLTMPRIDFADFYGGGAQAASPLIYELYLNKYRNMQ